MSPSQPLRLQAWDGGSRGGGAGTGGDRDTEFGSVCVNHLRLHAKQHIGWTLRLQWTCIVTKGH